MDEVERKNTLSFLSNTDLFEDDSDCNSDVGDVSDSDDAMSRNDDATLRDNDAHNRDPGGNSKRKHKPREKKPRKLPKGELLKMHSESQRMIRESQTCLPSYQPKLKTLDGFLIKLKNRTPTDGKLRKATPKLFPALANNVTQEQCHDHISDTGGRNADTGDRNADTGDIGDRNADTGDTGDRNAGDDCGGDQENSISHANEDRCLKKSPQHLPLSRQQTSPQKQTLPRQQVSQQSEDFELYYHDSDSERSSIPQEHNLPWQPSVQEATPTLCAFDKWRDSDCEILTPLEKFQRRVLSQMTTPINTKNKNDNSLQSSLKQGGARQLRNAIKSQLSKKKVEEFKKREEDRKVKEEILESDELSKLEEKLVYEEEYDISDDSDDDKGSYHSDGKNSNGNSDGDDDDGDDGDGDDGDGDGDGDDGDGDDGDDDGDNGDDDDSDDDDGDVIRHVRKISRIIDSDDDEPQPPINKPHPSILTDELHMSNESYPSTLTTDKPHPSTADEPHPSTLTADEPHPSTSTADEPHPSTLIADEPHYNEMDSRPHPLTVDANLCSDTELSQYNASNGDDDTPIVESEETRLSGNTSCLSDKELFKDFGPLTLTRTQMSVADEETQFLDANGFLCVHSEPNYTVRSAITDLIDDTPMDTPTNDMTRLCSGAFGSITKDPRTKQTKSERLLEFVESEAELSGSDVGPEESEGEEGEDGYEDDGASDIGLSDNELYNQVNKVHMKQVIADDKADIRNIKEKFLLEGDLYEDGMYMKNGFFRTRHFKHHGSETSMDLFSEDRNLDNTEECDIALRDSQSEAMKRKERLEKEEFIRKFRATSNSLLSFDDNSQSILDIIQDTSCPTINASDKPTNNSQLSSFRCGSFLKHKTVTLKKLSAYTAATSHVKSNSRSFVFQTETPKNVANAPTNKKKQVHSEPHPKKPCYKRAISLPQESIFHKFQ